MSKEQKDVKPQQTEQKKEQPKDDKEKYLKDYWYPSFQGEQNEILPSLKANVNRGSFLTRFVQFAVNSMFVLIPAAIFCQLFKFWKSYLNLSNGLFTEENKNVILVGFIFLTIVVAMVVYILTSRRRRVFLVDFACAWPEDKLKATRDHIHYVFVNSGLFNETSIEFQTRLLSRTGLGNETYIPQPFHQLPIKTTMALAREECEIVMKNSCDQLFKQTGIDPKKDIDIVICNCSLFNPTPSISAMLMNMYEIKTTCKNYNLAGMGCSAGLVSIDLARDLLNVYPNINVLVFSTENITQNWYNGQMKGMLMSNTLFRMGGAAILLSNKKSWKSKARFELLDTQRVHHGRSDEAYRAVFQFEDEDGIVGVKIGRELFGCVNKALTQNMNLLMPRVINYIDMFRFVVHFLKQKMGMIDKKALFLPDFRETFQAYCIHAGGRAIIDGIQDTLKLTDEDCMPSRATLYRVGNTSSSSVWYELLFTERCETLKRGDKVWQVAFGSGLKCNSCVWRKLN